MTYSVEAHVALKRVAEVAASPCGTWLAVSVQRVDRDGAKYVSDLWKVPLDGGAALQLTRGDCKDAAPCFRHDGSLAFLSNRQPNEVKPDAEAEKRMQIWLLPAEGGEPRQLTDEPLGVEGYRFAKRASRLVYFAPVLAGVAHDKQRETAADRAKHGPSARRFASQPVRHWDHWLHENPDFACSHLIACDANAAQRVDVTPEARREFAIEPALDVSGDGRYVAATRQSIGADRELDTTLLIVDLVSGASRVAGVADRVNFDAPVFSPDGKSIAATRLTRSSTTAIRPLATIVDTASGELRTLAAAWDRWPLIAGWSNDGSQLIVTADDAGQVPVCRIALADGGVERVTPLAAGGMHTNLAVLADGRIAGIRSTLLDAPECFVMASRPGSTPVPLARLSGFAGAGDWAE